MDAPDGGSGSFALSSGFRPDPHVVEGTTGGAIRASTLDSACSGWVSSEPDHRFEARDAFTELRFVVNTEEHGSTIVIERPDGSFVCSEGAEQDGVETYVTPGEHAIRIGSLEQGEQLRYRLAVTELPHLSAGSIGEPGSGPPGGDGRSNFATVSLAPGFEPDPTVVEGAAGGLIDASERSAQCSGWITERPDHVLVAEESFETLRLVVASEVDTTLVVERPDGTFLCNDDAEGRNPLVESSFGQGDHHVWIGAYRSGETARYRLGFTTRPELEPGDLR